MKFIEYEFEYYNFGDVVAKWFGVDDLTKLHKHNSIEYERLDFDHDQSTEWHKRFYELFNQDGNQFKKLYLEFMENYIKPRYDENILYQRIPTFRIHLPMNIAVGEWHKDKDYRDLDWAESVGEVNYYLPLTDTNFSNTIWSETEEDKGDYRPIEAGIGECVEWDGSNLTHGNKTNITSYTRVSVDFRVIPKSRFRDSDYLSSSSKMMFSEGNYYREL